MRMCLCVYVCVGAGLVGQTRAVGFYRYIWSHDTSGAGDDSAIPWRLRWCAQRWASVTGYLFFPPALSLSCLLSVSLSLSPAVYACFGVRSGEILSPGVCVYVCIYKYVYVYKEPFSDQPVGVGKGISFLCWICVWVHIYICICTHTYMRYVHIHEYILANAYKCTYTHVHRWSRCRALSRQAITKLVWTKLLCYIIRVCIHTCFQYTHVCVYTYTYIYTYTYVIGIHIYLYILIYVCQRTYTRIHRWSRRRALFRQTSAKVLWSPTSPCRNLQIWTLPNLGALGNRRVSRAPYASLHLMKRALTFRKRALSFPKRSLSFLDCI